MAPMNANSTHPPTHLGPLPDGEKYGVAVLPQHAAVLHRDEAPRLGVHVFGQEGAQPNGGGDDESLVWYVRMMMMEGGKRTTTGWEGVRVWMPHYTHRRFPTKQMPMLSRFAAVHRPASAASARTWKQQRERGGEEISGQPSTNHTNAAVYDRERPTPGFPPPALSSAARELTSALRTPPRGNSTRRKAAAGTCDRK